MRPVVVPRKEIGHLEANGAHDLVGLATCEAAKQRSAVSTLGDA